MMIIPAGARSSADDSGVGKRLDVGRRSSRWSLRCSLSVHPACGFISAKLFTQP